MLRIIATAIAPVILAVLAPLGITHETPVGDAVVLLVVGLGTGMTAWYLQRGQRQD